jgi:glycosyltransferase involved in cell wall biosynthesis
LNKKNICIFNNYSTSRVLKEIELGESPSHLVFGISELKYKYNFYFAEDLKGFCGIHILSKFLNLILRFFLPGDIEKQLRVWLNRDKFHLVYSCSGDQTNILQFMRSINCFSVPIITLVHHRPNIGRLDFLRNNFRKKIYSGSDNTLCLSSSVANYLNEKFLEDKTAKSISWGPTLSFYPKIISNGEGIVCAGRTGRDFNTLLTAAEYTNIKITVIYLDGEIDHTKYLKKKLLKLIKQPRMEPVPGYEKGWMKHRELLRFYSSAQAIAIPLLAQDSLAGLTSLVDCMGMGKPLLMTRNKNIDIDIEKEGIGFWIQPGDVKGWVNALIWVYRNPQEAYQMGTKARALCKRKYNINSFSNQLDQVISSEIHRHSNI